ncbi:MAG: hypothetical protein WEC33_01140, partial [Dehalococcoidia bacterium]
GIRATAMATVLAEGVPGARVTLAGPNPDATFPPGAPFDYVSFRPRNVLQLIARHDIIVTGGMPPHAALLWPTKRFVVDLFTQFAMEWMEVGIQAFEPGSVRNAWVHRTRAILAMQLTMADFILCCNERQRDSYLGMLMTLGLVSPRAYEADPALRRLIDAAPHGIRSGLPTPGPRVLRGVHPGFKETDKIILWNGGIVQWYDPATLLEALRILDRDDVKLLFLGAAYPGLESLGRGIRFQDARAIAARNGQLDRTVFFYEGWVPHETASQYVLEADISACTYFDNLETRYSHRTRFVDLIWGELPFVCTHGDILAEDAERKSWGVVVPQADPQAVAAAIARLLDDPDFYARCKANLAAEREALQWAVTMKPLVDFCNNPSPLVSPKWERVPG